MVGQIKLLERLNSLNIDSFPQSLILIGPEGCGKHTFSNEIATHLGLDLIDITDNLNKEYIDELYLKCEPHIYLIDGSKITIKEQNIILKFLEEPLKNSFLIILTLEDRFLLDTVLNRCEKWRFSSYSEEELSKFGPINNVVETTSLFNTPGRRKLLNSINIEGYYNLITKILEKINVASLPNTLSIGDKIAFKGEKDKLNLNIFKICLLEKSLEYIKYNKIPFNMFDVIRNYICSSYTPRISQRMLFDNFLISLWEVSRDDS